MIETTILILVLIILLSALYAATSAAPWLPTKRKDTKRAVKLANLKDGQRVYDLGCGDGRLLIKAYKNNPNIKIIGVEISILFFLITKLNFLVHKIKGRAVLKDLFKMNLSDADIIFVYLMPKCYSRLIEKFNKELKQGAKIIVGVWPVPEWEDKLLVHSKPSENDLSLFVYEMK